jgi:TonB family protein
VVWVHFVVTRNGRLDKLEIGQSSGDDTLDDAAYTMMHKAQPLPSIPDRMHVDHVDGAMPIIFGKLDQHFNATPGHCGGS